MLDTFPLYTDYSILDLYAPDVTIHNLFIANVNHSETIDQVTIGVDVNGMHMFNGMTVPVNVSIKITILLSFLNTGILTIVSDGIDSIFCFIAKLFCEMGSSEIGSGQYSIQYVEECIGCIIWTILYKMVMLE